MLNQISITRSLQEFFFSFKNVGSKIGESTISGKLKKTIRLSQSKIEL